MTTIHSTMHPTDVNAALINLLRKRSPAYWQSTAIGLTPELRPIMALQDTRTLPFSGDDHRPSVLLVAGLRGETTDTPRILTALERFTGTAAAQESGVALSVIVAANPDALSGGDWEEAADSKVDLTVGYPPEDGFYFDATAPERRYLWRWVCYQAPDLVVEVALSDDGNQGAVWQANAAAAGGSVASILNAVPETTGDSLVAALGQASDGAPGAIPALRLTTHWTGLTDALRELWAVTCKDADVPPSPGGMALEARRARTPVEIARILAGRYGHALDPVNYTQGVGVSGRLRLAELDPAGADPTAEIAELIAPIADNPDAYLEGAGGAALTGVVWAARLADYTGDERYPRLFFNAVDRFAPRPHPEEAPSPCDPDFRVEDMFMCGAMLGRAYRITGDGKYAALLARFLIEGGDVQDGSGLFKHARSAPHFWSRGNGFAALGYAEALTYLPQGAAWNELLARHRRHLDALLRRQQPWGTFGELVDVPGAWGELTSTCMIGYALARGLREGWLPDGENDGYRAGVDLCWRAVSERVDDDGGVVDGCISTGVMPDLRAYMDRAALSGHDDRTGSMALWFACEMERLRRV